MPLSRTIIFAADLSDCPREAFGVACVMARQEATRLIVLHVVEPLPVNETMAASARWVSRSLPPRSGRSIPTR